MAADRPDQEGQELVEVPSHSDGSRRTSHESNRSKPPSPDDNERGLDLHRTRSHVSTTHDAAVAESDNAEIDDKIYDRFSRARKVTIVTVLSICSFLAPISSTSILAAAPEVVATFNTTSSIFGLSNALYMISMGISPLFYGPMGSTFGRRRPLIMAGITFTAFSVGTALAPNLAAYFVFRILSALQGTCFLIVGSTVIGDIYRHAERGTAYGWFLTGTLIGPALGPLTGGIIVTFVSWRDTFWLQAALATAATAGVIFFIPETSHHTRTAELKGLTRKQQAGKLWTWMNPWRVIRLFKYPNVLVAGVASSSLVWNMYSLLSPIRYVINPRFGLESPLLGALFYLAPGAGYLLGTLVGGRYSDHILNKYTKKRGKRVAEDRLRAVWVPMGIVIPACMIIYGWSIQKRKGDWYLPAFAMFVQGVAQLICFATLNTYCVDVMQKRSSELVAGNYVVRYAFAAAGSAACLPAIEKIGVGWFSTISAALLMVAGAAMWLTVQRGTEWRQAVGKHDPEYEEKY